MVTPIARNTWRLRDQTYLDLLEEFADVCLELGAQYGIPVLDLHAHSKEYVLEKGLQDAKPIFSQGIILIPMTSALTKWLVMWRERSGRNAQAMWRELMLIWQSV